MEVSSIEFAHSSPTQNLLQKVDWLGLAFAAHLIRNTKNTEHCIDSSSIN